METTTDLDTIRETALAEVDRSERRVRLLIACAALVEGALLATFLVLMNFDDRLHWLLLVASLLTYGTLSVGLMTLGAYMRLNAQRTLKAIALLDRPGPGASGTGS